MSSLKLALGFAAASLAIAGYVRSRDKTVKRNYGKRMSLDGGSMIEEQLTSSFQNCTPKDWKYIAEGALNLALRYVGDDPGLRGYVLRVRKDNPHAAGGKTGGNPWEESLRFVEKLIVPLFGRRYVQPATEVPLPPGFMKELGALIESSRPVARRIHTLDMGLHTGLLMLDNTSIPLGKGPSICFELKIKCGFIPKDCPFVTHDVKKRVDRFQMHQQQKNASGKLDTVSRYSPPDLFSYDKNRVMFALECLVETPQNNFRMFVDGRMVYPDSKGHGSKAILASILENYPEISGGVDGLLDTLSALLVREPLLDRIKTVQQMDDCDIEAVWPVYQNILKRNESILPLADGDTIKPRAPPTSMPKSPEEEHDTVRRFMLSCTAKDCSTMIVLKPSSSTQEKFESVRGLPISTRAPRTIVQGFHGYMYSIAVVDLDPKPLSKMEHYFTLDKKIAETYAKLEKDNKLL